MSCLLDPAKLKVVELRAELTKRGLDPKGNKPALVKRLKEALEEELKEEIPDTSIVDTSTEDLNASTASDEPAVTDQSTTQPVPESKEEIDNVEGEETPSVIDTPSLMEVASDDGVATQKPESVSNQNDEPSEVEASSDNDVVAVGVPEQNEVAAESVDDDKVAAEDADKNTSEILTAAKENGEQDEPKSRKSRWGSEVETVDTVGQDEAMLLDADQNETVSKTAADDKSTEGKGEKRKHGSVSPDRSQRRRSRSPIKEDEPVIDNDKVQLSWYDSDLHLQLDKESFLAAKPLHEGAFGFAWAGVRATHGISTGKVCYEVKITEQLKWDDFSKHESRSHHRDQRHHSSSKQRSSHHHNNKDKDGSKSSSETPIVVEDDKSKNEEAVQDKSENWDDADKAENNSEIGDKPSAVVEEETISEKLPVEETEADLKDKPEVDEQKDDETSDKDKDNLDAEIVTTSDTKEETTIVTEEEKPKEVDDTVIVNDNKSTEEAMEVIPAEDEITTKNDDDENKTENDLLEGENKKEDEQSMEVDGGSGVNKEEEEKPVEIPIPTHLCRIGWSMLTTGLQLGESKFSYGYESTGKFLTDKKFQDYGVTFTVGDVIGSYLNINEENVIITYTVNGVAQPEAINIPRSDLPADDFVLFPHVLSRNYAFEFNLGAKEEAWFKHPDDLVDYVYLDKVEDKVAGPVRPENRSDCEVVLMCGLPGSGKTYWVREHVQSNLDKNYTVLGNTHLLEKMTVSGEPLKTKYKGRWTTLLDKLQKSINRLVEMAALRRRNYIIDQTNVFPSAQRRKLRPFEGFKRRAVVVVVGDEEQTKRQSLQEAQGGKDVADSTILEMKANMGLPEKSDWVDEVTFAELDETEAKAIVQKYNSQGRDAGYGGSGKKFGHRDDRHRWQNRHSGSDYRRGGGSNYRDRNYQNNRYNRTPPQRQGGGWNNQRPGGGGGGGNSWNRDRRDSRGPPMGGGGSRDWRNNRGGSGGRDGGRGNRDNQMGNYNRNRNQSGGGGGGRGGNWHSSNSGSWGGGQGNWNNQAWGNQGQWNSGSGQGNWASQNAQNQWKYGGGSGGGHGYGNYSNWGYYGQYAPNWSAQGQSQIAGGGAAGGQYGQQQYSQQAWAQYAQQYAQQGQNTTSSSSTTSQSTPQK